MVQGGLDPDLLILSNRFYGVIYFVLWQVHTLRSLVGSVITHHPSGFLQAMMMLVLINIFLAIINDAYDDAKDEDEDSYGHCTGD